MTGSKARWKRLLAYMLAFAMVFSSAAVSSFGTATVQAASKSIKSVKVQLKVGSKDVTKKTITLGKGCKVNVDAIVRPKSAKKSPVKFASAKKSVATVNKNGIITGKKVGTAKINVTATGKDNKKVTTYVKVKVVNVSLKLNKKNASLNVGKTTTLKATVTPKDSKVTWSTSNKSVATVTKKGVVKGVKAGTATITAKAGTKKATCKVTVKAATSSVAVTDVQIPTKTAEINVGGITNMNASVLPANATDKTLKYESSNPSVATVDAAGAIVGVGAGTATITAKSANGKSASMQVTVKFVNATGVTVSPNEIPVGIGSVRTLTATVLPVDASNKAVSWNSSTPAIATVDSEGKVTGVAEGTATITATTEDGGFSATCQVTVIKNDGMEIRLLNPYKGISNNDNTVLFGDNMLVGVDLHDGDVPAKGENVVLTLKSRYRGVGYEVKNKSAITNEAGHAEFVVGIENGLTNDGVMDASNTGIYDLVVTRTKANDNSNITQKELTVNVATINVEGIQVVSGNLEPSEEATDWKGSDWTGKANSVITTYASYKEDDYKDQKAQEYVVSQKVSRTSTSENQVEFGVSANLAYGKTIKEELNDWVWNPEQEGNGGSGQTSSIYNKADDQTTQTISKELPEGINSLRINFRKIALSEYTAIYVEVSGKDFKESKTIKDSSNLDVGKDEVGKQESIQFGNLKTKKGLRLIVSLKTEGQVKNNGESYIISEAIGTYDTAADDEFDSHPITSDKYVKWTDVSEKVNYETISVKDGSSTSPEYNYNFIQNLGVPVASEYKIRIPVFPYSGDAFIEAVGGNTYLYPTQNEQNGVTSNQKLNVNRIVNTGKRAIRITNAEEATYRCSGCFEQVGNNAIVNSTKTGMTALKAEISIPGVESNVFNKQNGGILYTSVQWAPTTKNTEEAENEEYYAVEGQTVRIAAQLCDVNGNKVAQDSEPIYFEATDADFARPTDETDRNDRGIYSINNGDDERETQVDIVSKLPDEVEGAKGIWKTDKNGRVEIDLQGIKGNSVVKDLKATIKSDKYDVKLTIIDANDKEKDITNGKSNIYWVDLGLGYIHKVGDPAYTFTEDKQSPSTAENNPASNFQRGQRWNVGYFPVVKNDHIKEVKGIQLDYTLTSTDIPEAKDKAKPYMTENNNQVELFSDEIGTIYLNGSIKNTGTDLANVEFVTKKGVVKTNIGRGNSGVAGNTILTHTINWNGDGRTVAESGIKYRWVSGNASYGYIGLVDKNGKGYPNVDVKYWVTDYDTTDIVPIRESSNTALNGTVSDNKVSVKTSKETKANVSLRGYAPVKWVLDQLEPNTKGYRIEAEYYINGQLAEKTTYGTYFVDPVQSKEALAGIGAEVSADDTYEANEEVPSGFPITEGNEANLPVE